LCDDAKRTDNATRLRKTLRRNLHVVVDVMPDAFR
jgi:hypothetical protein